ncbi:MAG: hypothetical protein QXO40_03885 [Candidatus Aenigmatarchaeota archaeon]
MLENRKFISFEESLKYAEKISDKNPRIYYHPFTAEFFVIVDKSDPRYEKGIPFEEAKLIEDSDELLKKYTYPMKHSNIQIEPIEYKKIKLKLGEPLTEKQIVNRFKKLLKELTSSGSIAPVETYVFKKPLTRKKKNEKEVLTSEHDSEIVYFTPRELIHYTGFDHFAVAIYFEFDTPTSKNEIDLIYYKVPLEKAVDLDKEFPLTDEGLIELKKDLYEYVMKRWLYYERKVKDYFQKIYPNATLIKIYKPDHWDSIYIPREVKRFLFGPVQYFKQVRQTEKHLKEFDLSKIISEQVDLSKYDFTVKLTEEDLEELRKLPKEFQDWILRRTNYFRTWEKNFGEKAFDYIRVFTDIENAIKFKESLGEEADKIVDLILKSGIKSKIEEINFDVLKGLQEYFGEDFDTVIKFILFEDSEITKKLRNRLFKWTAEV